MLKIRESSNSPWSSTSESFMEDITNRNVRFVSSSLAFIAAVNAV
jgi:hypothetical protein